MKRAFAVLIPCLLLTACATDSGATAEAPHNPQQALCDTRMVQVRDHAPPATVSADGYDARQAYLSASLPPECQGSPPPPRR